MTNVVLLGAPGAGKGTQAELLAARLGIPHVSTGDLFREAARGGSPIGLEARRYMERGQLVPDDITIRMLLERLDAPDAAAGVILDGFPRNRAQAEELASALAERGSKVDRAVNIEMPTDEIVRRLSGRWVCRDSGHVYNEFTNPPTVAGRCDLDGSPLVQREDDKPDTIRARLDHQLASLREVVDYYEEAGLLRGVNGVQPIEQVTEDLLSAIEERPLRGGPRGRADVVTRKSRAEIARMRRAGRVVAEVLALVEEELKPGVTTGHLDRLAEAHIRKAGAIPSFKGYPGINPRRPFPGSLCISIDDEIVHGIPGERAIRAGQVVSIDAGAIVDGWHGDAARTFFVGEPSPKVRQLIDTTRPAMMAGIARGRAGQPHRGHLGRCRGRRQAPRLRRHPPVRRPRDRHRDARGAAGPQLPNRPSRPQARARPVPGDRADVHAGRLSGPRPRGRLDRVDRRWLPGRPLRGLRRRDRATVPKS